jgi:hypothetical protein
MNFRAKEGLAILCDHCMGPMTLVELHVPQMPVSSSAPALHCSLCQRIYTTSGGYRDNPAFSKGDDKRPFVTRCKEHMQALCIIGFAVAGNERMKLVCPVEGCDVRQETDLSEAFRKGY